MLEVDARSMAACNGKAVEMFRKIVSQSENKVFLFKYILTNGMSSLHPFVSYTNKSNRDRVMNKVVDHLSMIEIQDHPSLEVVKTFRLFQPVVTKPLPV
jgi:hypothetical protein